METATVNMDRASEEVVVLLCFISTFSRKIDVLADGIYI